MMTSGGVGWDWPIGLLMVGCWAAVFAVAVWLLAALTRSTSSSQTSTRVAHLLRPRRWGHRQRPESDASPTQSSTPTVKGL